MSDYSSSRPGGFKVRACFFAALAFIFVSTRCIAAEIIVGDNVGFEATSCWNQAGGKAVTECGWLIVPEDWDNPEARKIKLAVVIFRAVNPEPSLSPIIYLAGGPGGHPLGDDGRFMARWRRTADYSLTGHTLIVFDQRGTGLSSPKLDCREAQDATVWWPLSTIPEGDIDKPARVHAAFAACMARHLAAGRQLNAFNTLQSATDVEALRRALELEDIILYGLSYGTRLALTVMKLYPRNIEAAILDSVFPPKAEYAGSDAGTFGPALDRLFATCKRDEDCAMAYPDLRGRLLRVLTQLARQPVTVEITNYQGGEPLYARVDHRMFLEVLRNGMADTARLHQLPLLISGAAEGEYWRLVPHIENTVFGYFPGSYALGAMLAVRCNDDAGLARPQEDPDGSATYAYLRDYAEWYDDYSFCEFWPMNPNTRNRDAVVSDIPSLLLAGGLDAATTVEQAEMAAETLRNSHLFVFPAHAHVQLRGDPCAWEIVIEFLANPEVRPSPDCLVSLRQSTFLSPVW